MQDPLVVPSFIRRYGPWALSFILLCAAYVLAQHIPQTLTIFALAALIAFGVAPITRKLESRMPRILAITVVYLGLIIALGIMLLLVIPSVIAQSQAIVSSAPASFTNTQSTVKGLSDQLQGRLGPTYAVGLEQVRTMVTSRLETSSTTVLASLGAFVLQAVTSVFVLISAIVLSVFFVQQAPGIAQGFRRFFPPERRELATEFEHELARVFGGFVSGQILLCVITAIIVWISLSLLKAPFAVLVAVAAGVGYAIPFVGMLVVQLGAALLALPYGWHMVLWVTVSIFAIARIIDSVLAPKVMADSVGVSPIAIMFAVFAGGELFGIIGFALGIPLAAFVKTLWNFFLLARAQRKTTLAESVEPCAVISQ